MINDLDITLSTSSSYRTHSVISEMEKIHHIIGDSSNHLTYIQKEEHSRRNAQNPQST